jgi:PKD repeat protein
MITMRSLVLSIAVVALPVIFLNSCNPAAPTACYEIDTLADSMHVGRTIIFDARCSSGARTYYWAFGNGATSTLEVPQTIYDTAGTYSVELVVSNNLKTALYTQSVTIMP